MAHVSLYRKYRPESFDQLVGQPHITTTLMNAIEQRTWHHAYLFTGPRGTGKTSTARLLAMCLNATDGPTSHPDPDDPIVKAIRNGTCPDVIEIDAASNNGVDDVRELCERVVYAPSQGRLKIYIVDECHMLSDAAWNAFLKTIEEPPAHVIFIFATTEPHKVIPTVLSRTQRMDFRRVTSQVLTELCEKIAQLESVSIQPEALVQIVKAGDGSVRDTLSVLDQVIAFTGDNITAQDIQTVLGTVPSERLDRLTQFLASKSIADVLGFIQETVDAGIDLQQFTTDAISHLRDLLLIATAPTGNLVRVSPERFAVLKAQSDHMGVATLLRTIQLLNDTKPRMRAGATRLPLELALVKAALPDYANDELALNARLDQLEVDVKRLGAGPFLAGEGAGSAPQPAAESTPPAPVAAAPVAAASAVHAGVHGDDPSVAPAVGAAASEPVVAPVANQMPTAPANPAAAPTPAQPAVIPSPTTAAAPKPQALGFAQNFRQAISEVGKDPEAAKSLDSLLKRTKGTTKASSDDAPTDPEPGQAAGANGASTADLLASSALQDGTVAPHQGAQSAVVNAASTARSLASSSAESAGLMQGSGDEAVQPSLEEPPAPAGRTVLAAYGTNTPPPPPPPDDYIPEPPDDLDERYGYDGGDPYADAVMPIHEGSQSGSVAAASPTQHVIGATIRSLSVEELHDLFRRQWPTIVQDVDNANANMGKAIRYAAPGSITHTHATIVFDTVEAKAFLESNSNKEIITGMISRALGSHIDLSFELAPSAANRATSTEASPQTGAHAADNQATSGLVNPADGQGMSASARSTVGDVPTPHTTPTPPPAHQDPSQLPPTTITGETESSDKDIHAAAVEQIITTFNARLFREDY